MLPEVGEIDVAALDIVKASAEVADKDIDEMIDTLRQQRRAWTPVERGASDADMVLFEFAAKGDGFAYPQDGRERVGTIIGSAAMSKALEDKLIGRASGDEFVTDIEFPADFRIAALAGKQANVVCKIVRVQKIRNSPEVDDAFITSFGIDAGGIEKFRADVRAQSRA